MISSLSRFSSRCLLLALGLLATVTSGFGVPPTNLYLGSNTSGQITNFTSGTNAFSNTYVGMSSSKTLTLSMGALVVARALPILVQLR
jgi:hypothetical protein